MQVEKFDWQVLDLAKSLKLRRFVADERLIPNEQRIQYIQYAQQLADYCFVYMISALGDEVCKIGFSRDLVGRMEYLRTSSPVPLKVWTAVIAKPEMETRIHRWLADCRYNGEWFFVDDRLWELRATMEMEGATGVERLLNENGY